MSARRSLKTGAASGWLTVALTVAACSAQPTAVPAARGSAVTALVGGRVQPAPDAATIADGVVLISQGVITAVGARAEIAVPPGATVLDCPGATGPGGLWNSHRRF